MTATSVGITVGVDPATGVRATVGVGAATGVRATVGVGTATGVGTSVIVNDCVTSFAAKYVSLPDWLAVNSQIPAFTIVTDRSDTVHTPGVDDVTVTVKLESNQTFTVNGVVEKVRSISGSPLKFC